MERTTVYLPKDLKRKLAEQAKVSGRSQAELIREAIREILSKTTPEGPRFPLVESHQPHLLDLGDELLEGFGEH